MNLELLYSALSASVEASKAIMEIYQESDFGVSIKDDSSPLTKADLASNAVIHKILDKTGIPFLSEEGKGIPYQKRKDWEYLWVVDPLDGTKEFIKRNGEFTVNIALVNFGKPVLGVVAIPAQNIFYYAMKGFGAYKMDKKTFNEYQNQDGLLENHGDKLPLQSLPHKITVVGSRSHSSEETESFIKDIKRVYGEVEFLSKGSALKLCMIAEGKAHVYPRLAPTMEWDTAAGHVLILESGGGLLEFESKNEMMYNRENLRNPWFVAYAKGFYHNT